MGISVYIRNEMSAREVQFVICSFTQRYILALTPSIMDFVVDIQDFRDVNRQFLPKEMAVVALQELILGHW